MRVRQARLARLGRRGQPPLVLAADQETRARARARAKARTKTIDNVPSSFDLLTSPSIS